MMSADSTSLRIAVVLCTYNGERFLSRQLDSLLAQTRKPDEVVIVDDASTDGTWRLLEAWRAHVHCSELDVRLYRNPANLGYAKNFERALNLAEADLLFLCDQDDVWYAHKIERMAREFEQRPQLDLLHADARLIDAEGRSLDCGLFEAIELTGPERRAMHEGDGLRVLLRRNVVTGAATAIRRRCLAWAEPFPDGWVHDEWLAIACAVNGRVDTLEEPLIGYRQHGGNQIGVRRRTARDRMQARGTRRRLMRAIDARMTVLQTWMEERWTDAAERWREELAGRARHVRSRAHLPASWLARLAHVTREWRSGRYRRYSFGLRSAVADLLGLD